MYNRILLCKTYNNLIFLEQLKYTNQNYYIYIYIIIKFNAYIIATHTQIINDDESSNFLPVINARYDEKVREGYCRSEKGDNRIFYFSLGTEFNTNMSA